jgi:hypothetical protein
MEENIEIIDIGVCHYMLSQLDELSRFKNQGHAFPRADTFSPRCTMTSARGTDQLGEWSRIINQGQLFFYA